MSRDGICKGACIQFSATSVVDFCPFLYATSAQKRKCIFRSKLMICFHLCSAFRWYFNTRLRAFHTAEWYRIMPVLKYVTLGTQVAPPKNVVGTERKSRFAKLNPSASSSDPCRLKCRILFRGPRDYTEFFHALLTSQQIAWQHSSTSFHFVSISKQILPCSICEIKCARSKHLFVLFGKSLSGMKVTRSCNHNGQSSQNKPRLAVLRLLVF